MKVTSKTTSCNKQIKSLMRRLQSLDNRHVEVGYYEEDQHPSGKSMAEIASIQEYGDDNSNIPARPFMSQSLEYSKNMMEADSRWKKDLWEYLSGKGKINTFLKKQGEYYGKESIQIIINRQEFVDNVAWWKAAKSSKYGMSQILYETGSLYEDIRVKVVES